jgi:hypothetical protein
MDRNEVGIEERLNSIAKEDMEIYVTFSSKESSISELLHLCHYSIQLELVS